MKLRESWRHVFRAHNGTCSRTRSILFVLASILALPTVSIAQDGLEFDLERNAASYGEPEAGRRFVLSPLAAGPGRVFLEPLPLDPTNRVRLHTTITSQPREGRLFLRVTQQGKAIWESRHDEETRRAFWSDEVGGSGLAIEVHVTGSSSGAEVAIDMMAMITGAMFEPQATTLPDCQLSVA